MPPEEVQMDKADDDRRLDRGVTVASKVMSSEAAVASACENDSTVRTFGDDAPPPDETRLMLL